MTAAATEAPHTTDSFLGGRVRLLQPKKGHRAGLDAALLQALVPADTKGLVVDLGAGVGTVAFCTAARCEAVTVIAVEREPALAALADEALRLPENGGFAPRVRIVTADVARRDTLRPSLGADWGGAAWVLMNPPFDTSGRVRPSPDAGRAGAHVGEAGLIADWCRSASQILKPGGSIGLIHRADALPEALAALKAASFGSLAVLPAHPAKDAPAGRVLVTGQLGSRAPFSLMPGLVLHAPGGGWTAEADAILRGEASLSLSPA